MFFFFVKYDKKIVFHYHFSLDITPLDYLYTYALATVDTSLEYVLFPNLTFGVT